MLERLGQDVAFAVRTLRKAPVFSAIAVLTLALGIGANTAIFSVINAVLLKPLPFRNGERIVHLQQPATRADVPDVQFSPLELADYRAQSRSFEQLVEYHTMSFNLIGRGEPHRGHILGMVLRQGSALIGAGLAIGVAGALVLTRFMSGFVFGITPNDPLTFAIVVTVLAAVGLMACVGPARRAASIQPVVALRE